MKKRNYMVPALVLVLIIILGVIAYLAFFSSPFLKNYDDVIDFEKLVDTTNFSQAETKSYTAVMSTVTDLEFSNGKLLLVDENNHRIMVFNNELQNLRNIGEKYDAEKNMVVSGQTELEEMFSYPASVAFDSSGNLYVIDRLNMKIKVFDSSLNFVSSIEIPEDIVEDFEIADTPNIDGTELNFEVLSNGNFAIHFISKGKLMILSPQMEIVNQLTLQDGRISNIKHSEDKLYVVNDIKGKVLEYDNNLSQIGSLNVSLNNPYDLCILNGKVAISDRGSGSLKIVDLSTKEVSTGIIGSGALPSFIACDSAENIIYVYDDSTASLEKINASSFQILSKVESEGDSAIKKGAPAYVAISPLNEDVAFTNPQDNVIMILDSSLSLKKVLSVKFGDSPDAFKFPSGVTYDSEGNLYVVDRLNRKIKVYDSEYNYLRSIGNIGDSVLDVIVLDDGRILYAENSNGGVFLLDSNGTVVDNLKQGPIGDYNNKLGVSIPDGEFVAPKGIGYYGGKFYVVDRIYPKNGSMYTVTINQFDSDRNFIKRYFMTIPDETGMSETVGLYGSIAMIPNEYEDSLYFYDFGKGEIIDKLVISHEIAWSGFEVEISPDESYAIVTTQKDGKLFKIDLKSRKIIDEKRVAEYYQSYSD